MDVAFAQDEVLLAPDLDLEAGVGREQHPVAFFEVADRRADRHDLRPGEAAVEVGGGRDEDAAAALAVAGVVGRQDQQPVGGHADRLLGIVRALGGAGSHDRRLPSPAFLPPASNRLP